MTRWCDFRPVVTVADVLEVACFDEVTNVVKREGRIAMPVVEAKKAARLQKGYVERAAVSNGDSYGDSSGSGYGYGDGSGSGSGYGYGDGSGYGSGYGSGSGSGSGSGY